MLCLQSEEAKTVIVTEKPAGRARGEGWWCSSLRDSVLIVVLEDCDYGFRKIWSSSLKEQSKSAKYLHTSIY